MAPGIPTPRNSDDRQRALAACFASFPRFCGLLRIQPKQGGGRIPLVLSPLQLEYEALRTRRDIVLKGRQVHFTTIEAARDFHQFVTKRGSRVVVVVQSQSDDKPLKDISYKFQLFVDSIRAVIPDIRFGSESGREWTLPERDSTLSIIVAGASARAAQKKGRGGTINRLHVSEASTYENAEETMTALMGSVAQTGSEIVIESTPKGAVGWYYDQWQAAVTGKSVFRPHFLEWWKHDEYRVAVPEGFTFQPVTALEEALFRKGVTVESLLWYREQVRTIGNADQVNQEYPSDPDTCFLLSGRSFFDAKKVAEAIRATTIESPIYQHVRDTGCVQHLHAGVEVPVIRAWYPPEEGRQYVVSADPSEGTGGSASAGGVFERGTGRHMASIWGQLRPWVFTRWLVLMARKYNGAMIAPERNNHGGTVLRSLDAEQKYKNVFVDRDGKPGFNTTVASRAPILDALEEAFRNGHFKTQDHFLLTEMRTLVVNQQGKAEHAPGARDDLVMMAAIGWDVVCRALPKKKDWVDELPSV